MKTYRAPRELTAEIECILATHRPTSHTSPLNLVVEALVRGRHYSWVGIYLALGKPSPRQLLGSGSDPHPRQTALADTRTKILIAMKVAGREVGALDVESERDHAFGSEDQVFLEDVAGKLARFLVGPGKYLVRKARVA